MVKNCPEYCVSTPRFATKFAGLPVPPDARVTVKTMELRLFASYSTPVLFNLTRVMAPTACVVVKLADAKTLDDRPDVLTTVSVFAS